MMVSQQHQHGQPQRQRMSVHNTNGSGGGTTNNGHMTSIHGNVNTSQAGVDHRADSDIQLALQTELKVLAAALAIETSALHLHNEHHTASTTGNNTINGLSNLLDQLVNVCTVSRLAEDLDAGVDNVICALTEMSRLLLTTVASVYLYEGNGVEINDGGVDNGPDAEVMPSSRASGSGASSSGRNHGNGPVDIMGKLHVLIPNFPMWFTSGNRFNAAFTHVHSLLERHAQGRPIDLQSLNDGLFAIRDACDVCYELLENTSVNAAFNASGVNGTMNGHGSASHQRRNSLTNYPSTHTGNHDSYSRERVNSAHAVSTSNHSSSNTTNGSNSAATAKKNGGRSSGDSRRASNHSSAHEMNAQSLWEEHQPTASVFNGSHAHMHLRNSTPNISGASEIAGGPHSELSAHGQAGSHGNQNQPQVMMSSETSKMWAMGPSLLFTPPPTPEDASSPTIARSVHRPAINPTDSSVPVGGSKGSKSGSKNSKGAAAPTPGLETHGLNSTASKNRNIANNSAISPRTPTANERDAAAKAAFESAPNPDVMHSIPYSIPATSIGGEYDDTREHAENMQEHLGGGLERSDSSELLSSDLIHALDDATTDEESKYAESMMYQEPSHVHTHTHSSHPRSSRTGSGNTGHANTAGNRQGKARAHQQANTRGSVDGSRKSSHDAYAGMNASGVGYEDMPSVGLYEPSTKNPQGRSGQSQGQGQTQRQASYPRARNGSGDHGKRGNGLPSNDTGFAHHERQHAPQQPQFGSTSVIGGGFRTPTGMGSSGLHDANSTTNSGMNSQGMHGYAQGTNTGFMTEGGVMSGSAYNVNAGNEAHANSGSAQDPSTFISASAPASVVGSPAPMRRTGAYMAHLRNTHTENTGSGNVGPDGMVHQQRPHNGHMTANPSEGMLSTTSGGMIGGSNPAIVREYSEMDWYGSTVGTNTMGAMSMSANQQSVPTPAQPTLSSIAAQAPTGNHAINSTQSNNSSVYAGGDSNLPWKERPTGFRVVMCRHMDSKGKCKKAGTCTFAHSQASLEKFRALYIPTEKCNYGAKCAYRNAGGCRYSHTPLEQHKSIKVYNAAVATSMKSKADS